MSKESERPSTIRSSRFDNQDLKTTISDKSYEQIAQEAKGKEISKAELVRHIIYDYQKKEASQSKSE